MWKTNLSVMLVGAAVIGFYTMVASIIPQLQSEVPAELDLSGGVTAEALVSAGEGLFSSGGCTSCHGLGTRAPNLLTDHGGEGTIGARCGSRKPGMACKDYLHESLVDPTTFLVEGFPPIMPAATAQLDPDQIWAVVAYLESQGGEVTVDASDIESSSSGTPAAASGGGAPAGGAPAGFSATMDPRELLAQNACTGCHALGGAGPPIGPAFDGMGGRISADRIRRGILDPGAEVAEGFDQFAGMMPATFGQSLSAAQLEAIVQFLAGLR